MKSQCTLLNLGNELKFTRQVGALSLENVSKRQDRPDNDYSERTLTVTQQKTVISANIHDAVLTPLPMNTNALYDSNLRVLPDTSLPIAGLGAQFKTSLPKGAILRIYTNANTAKTSKLCSNSGRCTYI